ncbi:MAG: efflux RND transporter periplasmic adaptor subunit [Gemmataceae bacterium]
MPAQSERSRLGIFLGAILSALVLGFAIGVCGDYFFLNRLINKLPPEQECAPRKKTHLVEARGRIKPRDGILSLGVPTPDRIREIKVHEGDRVKERDKLVILDSEILQELEVEAANIQSEQAKKRLKDITANGKAQIHVAEIRLAQIKPLETIQIKALKSKIAFLKAQEKNAQENYKRFVAVGDSIADQDREKQELATRQIAAERIATDSELEKLTTSSALNFRLAEAQLQAARAELRQSKSSISLPLLDTHVKQAREHLKDSRILAPSNGKILRILLHKGELVRGEPILQMANVEYMIVLAEVYETDIERVKIGQPATITSRIFGKDKDELTGKVIAIASTVGKAQTVPLDPRAAVDNRVVEVKIKVDQPSRVADFIDHQVIVQIDTNSKEEAK